MGERAESCWWLSEQDTRTAELGDENYTIESITWNPFRVSGLSCSTCDVLAAMQCKTVVLKLIIDHASGPCY